MPKGYWVVTANITDPEAFTPYRETAGAVIADHGGHAIIRGDVTELVEGESHGRGEVGKRFADTRPRLDHKGARLLQRPRHRHRHLLLLGAEFEILEARESAAFPEELGSEAGQGIGAMAQLDEGDHVFSDAPECRAGQGGNPISLFHPPQSPLAATSDPPTVSTRCFSVSFPSFCFFSRSSPPATPPRLRPRPSRSNGRSCGPSKPSPPKSPKSPVTPGIARISN